MKKKPLAIIDVDDYFLAYVGPYITWLFSQTKYDIDTYKPETWFNTDYVKDFSTNYLSTKRPINEGVLSFILSIKDSHDILFLSSCGVDHTKTQKKCIDQALWNTNVTYNLQCLELNEDKFKIVKKLKPAFVLDDKRVLIEKCLEKGIKASYSKDFNELKKLLEK
jgi:hypothetical protein